MSFGSSMTIGGCVRNHGDDIVVRLVGATRSGLDTILRSQRGATLTNAGLF